MTSESTDFIPMPVPAEDDAIERAFAELDTRLSTFTEAVATAVDTVDAARADLLAAEMARTSAALEGATEELEADAAPETSTADREDVVHDESAEPTTGGAEETQETADESAMDTPQTPSAEMEHVSTDTADATGAKAEQNEPEEWDDQADEPEASAESVTEEVNGEADAHEADDQGDQPVATAPDDTGDEPEPSGTETAASSEEEPKRDVLGRIIQTPAGSEPVEATAEEPQSSADAEDEALLASLDEETAKAIRVMRRLSPAHKRVAELLEEYRVQQAAAAATPKSAKKKKGWFSRG